MCAAYQVSNSFGPRHSNSSPHSSYKPYIQGRGEEGLHGDVAIALVDVAKFLPPLFGSCLHPWFNTGGHFSGHMCKQEYLKC